MDIKLIATAEINSPNARARSHETVRGAAEYLGVSETTIRQAAYRLGVKRISGRTVAGAILIDGGRVDLCISYTA